MEHFDLYTKDRIPLHRTMERGKPVPDGSYRLVVHICIFNTKDEILIQQRQPFKSGWSNMWDLSVGGSALSGETSQQAAERELLEELGISFSLAEQRPVLTVHFDEGFDDIYTIIHDIDISKMTLQPEEVQTVKWASIEEIEAMIDSGAFIPYHKNLIELLFFMRNHRGTFTREDMD